MNTLYALAAPFLASGLFFAATAGAASPDRYDVTWESPSTDANGSMPLGNGDIGLNAWIEPSGELVFYIAKTDAWGDNARLLKVGRVRVTFDPPLPTETFRQTLRLRQGTMEAVFGQEKDATTLRLWVDANHPVIHVTTDGNTPHTATASIELWRTEPFELPSIECSDVQTDRSQPGGKHGPTIVEPDTLIENLTERVGWYHHNVKSIGPVDHARIQGMTGYERPDPLLHRTFGAVIAADTAQRLDDRRLQSPPSTGHCFSIFVLTRHPSTPQQWLAAMEQTIWDVQRQTFDARRAAHERWWADFWDRSWIDVTTRDDSKIISLIPENNFDVKIGGDEGLIVSRAYALQRFIDACAGRGRYPIKFNGSIFTVPSPGQHGDADYRRWGPGYWWQNTRLPYLSMCAAGDFEMMEPLMRMYVDDILPLACYRTRHYFGHGGAYYPECIQFWGDVFNESYGWTPFEERQDKLQASGWHKWEWVSGPELVFMMLDYHDYTRDQSMLQKRLLPTADAVLRFFDEHYATNADGKLVMHPAQSLETWWDCTNPMPELAGLYAMTARLQALPEDLTTPEQRQFWRTLQEKLPLLPTREVDGETALAPAERFANKRNIENPELYAVFPFRLVSFEKDNAALGTVALKHRGDRGSSGWRQDDIFMAYLGLADQARENLVGRARKHHRDSRFPAFWGPNYDWIPDQDHGGVLMKALQAMLLQPDPYSDKMYLLPAWPKDWNVRFKLHAPHRTTVECEFRDGRIVELTVAPAERRKDVVVVEPAP